MLARIVAVLSREESLEVPESVLHNAHAIFALRQPERVSISRTVAKLVYDSFREPSFAGVRSQQRISRQALYEAGDYAIDIRLETERGTRMVTLVGQVQKRKEPRARVAHLPVLLMAGKDLLASAISNEFGEFEMAYPQRNHVRLHVPVRPSGDWLEVGLADALDDDPPGDKDT